MQTKYLINQEWLEKSKNKANEMLTEWGNIDNAIFHCNTLANMMAYAQGDYNKPTFWDYVKYQLETIKKENYAL
jgi:hypothetical protein